MKKLFLSLTIAAAAVMGCTCFNLSAQDNNTPTPTPPPAVVQPGGPGPGGRGNFDPAQMQQQMQQRMDEFVRGKLAITNDDEWGIVETRLNKVSQQRMQVAFAGMGGMRAMMGGGNRPGRQGGNRGGGFMGMGQSSPEADALQAALDTNAPKEEVKTALENLRAARQRQKDELTKAQDDLRQLLTLRQEAVLVSLGILD